MPIAEDAYQGQPNPHAWMSPKLAEIYVENIRKAFTKLDPATPRLTAAMPRPTAPVAQPRSRTPRQPVGDPPAQRVLAHLRGEPFSLSGPGITGLEEAYLWPVNAESQVDPQTHGAVDRPGARSVRCRRCSVRAR